MYTVGEALQAALDKAGVSQALLAYRTGITTKHINRLVKDKARLSVEVAVQIEEAVPEISAKNLLLHQLRLEIDRVKYRKRRAKVIAPLDALDESKADLFEYAPGNE